VTRQGLRSLLFTIMKLIWSNSGDYLNLDPYNSEFSEYYMSTLSKDNANTFAPINSSVNLNCYTELRDAIKIISDLLVSKFKLTYFEKFLNLNLFDQAVLNELHQTWVLITLQNPRLLTVISKIDDTYLSIWNQINKQLHSIETDFHIDYHSNYKGWQTPNPYGVELLSFDFCQISIAFSQLGRTTFDKWTNFDRDVSNLDLNNFNTIGGELSIDLRRSSFKNAPLEYAEFCKNKNIPIAGGRLNLANFTNYEKNIATIKELFIKNLKNNNTIAFNE